MDVNKQDYKDFTCLMYSSQNIDSSIFDLLMSKKPKLDFQNNIGDTALILATKNDNDYVVK